MSALNDRERAELEQLRGAFRAFVLDEQPPSIELIIMTGIDKELLQKCVNTLRPLLDTLEGYEPLDRWFTSTDPTYTSHRTWLEEAGMQERYPRCLSILDTFMQDENESSLLPPHPQGQEHFPERRYAQLKVWLTHEGEWICWANQPASTFRIVENVEAALEAIEQLTPEGASLIDPQGTLRSPALCMFGMLRSILAKSAVLKAQGAHAEAAAYRITDALRSRFGD